MADSQWISTGKAAAIMGYSRAHFVKKFESILPSRRFDGGYRKWLQVEVEKLAEASAGQER